MPAGKLHIKNMVCRRCIMTVEDICRDLGIDATVALGSAEFNETPPADVMDIFHDRLRAVGFEPLQSHQHIVLENVKASIRHYARNHTIDDRTILSDYMRKTLNMDFRYISRMFSTLQGRTVQSYLMSQRIEYVKELLSDNQLTLAEIADKVGFSSVAHLSRAFKKSQGMTITRYRDNGTRSAIDQV